MTVQLEPSPKAPRKIKFNFNALAEYELLGFHVTETVGMGIANARALCYVGCKEADPSFSLSIDDVGKLMNNSNMTEIFEALSHDMTTLNGEEAKK
jgi:hypothetical protein